MSRLKSYAMIIFSLTMALMGCNVEKNVYVAGYGNGVAKLWKNGIAQNLTDGTYDAEANSVYVSGKDVYVVGYEDCGQLYESSWGTRNKSVAKLWINGIAQNLTDGTFKAHSGSVFVSGNNVYVAGHEMNAQDIFVVKLWKNGVVENLTDGSYETLAGSVYVSDNDVFVVGRGYNTQGAFTAKLWKNSVLQDLSDGTAISVFVK